MADIVFFEKPGCINGEKQKAILRAAGHILHCEDIISFPWNQEKLLEFVDGKDPVEMMNHTASAVKKGELVPEHLSFSEAVDMMVADPILIKRPLVEVNGLKIQGFMDGRLSPYLGDWNGVDDVVTCPNLKTLSCDEQKRGK
jgi:nitrogenase-associated protein